MSRGLRLSPFPPPRSLSLNKDLPSSLHVYLGRGTMQNIPESDALHPSEETVPERRSTVSGSTAGEDGSAALKTNVEANPVASKLGLSSPSPPRARLTANMVSRGRNSTALQHARQVRGLGRGRGPKPVIPGRGGRPWYSPVMSQASGVLKACKTNSLLRSNTLLINFDS